jgi:hypothetical protein
MHIGELKHYKLYYYINGSEYIPVEYIGKVIGGYEFFFITSINLI